MSETENATPEGEDAEGHRMISATENDDAEGHIRIAAADDDDVEGHRSALNN